jgi:hypothetical protein
MKRIIGLLLSCLLIFSSCDVDFRNEITEIHKEIDELRSMLEHANSNIEALQSIVAALESKDYVTSVTPMIVDGEEVGYTINFSKSGPVTIYQGEAPQMSVKKDDDGVWYWTVDDKWVLDGDGNKVRAEGVAPIVKIENERWYISYDDGESWNDLGEAKGDSMFKEVRVDENEGVVIFVMAADGMEYAVPLHRNGSPCSPRTS